MTLDNWGDLYFAQTAHVPAVKVALYFGTFIEFGTMIILNLFIGIIMNSMAEMHAEIAERDRAQQAGATAAPTVEDELESVEREMKALQLRLAGLRRKWRAEPQRLPATDFAKEQAS